MLVLRWFLFSLENALPYEPQHPLCVCGVGAPSLFRSLLLYQLEFPKP